MKKIFITVLVALTLVATAEAGHNKHAEPENTATEQVAEEKEQTPKTEEAVDEKTVDEKTAEQDADNNPVIKVGDIVSIDKNGIVVKKNGKSVKVKMDELNSIINDHLDDTVLSDDGMSVEVNGEDLNKIEVDGTTYNLAQDGMKLARDISTGFFVAIVWIVFFALLFYYLHRRRKYKTVDRAIQAGYPLPDEFFGKRSQPMPQQPTNVYVTQVTPPNADPNAPQGAQPAPGYGYTIGNPLNNITDWTPFKSGFRTTAVGLGLLFFFWILGVTPLAALMVIVVFIGLGKIFIAYQDQQSAKNYWQQQQWTQQAPQQPQQDQPQAPSQPADDVPPMPETPPEFNSMNE